MHFEVADILIVMLRWLHAMAAVVWIGYASVFLLVPQSAWGDHATALSAIEKGFREITDLAVPLFLLTGAILVFDRFARGVPGPSYIGILAAKLLLAFGMFHVAYRSRRTGLGATSFQPRLLAALGATVVLLATALKSLSGPTAF